MLHQAGAALVDRPATARVQGHSGWADFLRRMIDLAGIVSELHHRIRLNLAFRPDLQWWDLFLEDWNGLSVLSGVVWTPPSVVVTSDASDSWGCGAFSSVGEVVPIPVARGVGSSTYHREGAIACGGSLCSVGRELAGKDSPLPLR